jgi:hypothetical protein
LQKILAILAPINAILYFFLSIQISPEKFPFCVGQSFVFMKYTIAIKGDNLSKEMHKIARPYSTRGEKARDQIQRIKFR